MYCTHCGSSLHQRDNFCTHCGTPASKEKTVTQPKHSVEKAVAPPTHPSQTSTENVNTEQAQTPPQTSPQGNTEEEPKAENSKTTPSSHSASSTKEHHIPVSLAENTPIKTVAFAAMVVIIIFAIKQFPNLFFAFKNLLFMGGF